jgi:archaea-specific RecJ-like exonuclease
MSQRRKQKSPNFKQILKKPKSILNNQTRKTVNQLIAGDYFKGAVLVQRKVKPGPLILTIYDGTSAIDAIGHDRIFSDNVIIKDGATNYNFGNLQIKDSRKKNKPSKDQINIPNLKIDEIEVGNIVFITGKVIQHRNKLEIELEKIIASQKTFEDIIDSQLQPRRDTFSIESERYESMKTRYIEITKRIRKAIIERQPILIRHHNDADGICAGLMIEKAIENVILGLNMETRHVLYRSPSISPFYDQIDLFRDISKFNRYSADFDDKTPLILLLDTGSTPENLFAMQILDNFQFECIVVDHHNPGPLTDGKSSICDLLQYHLNPYLFGWDSQTSGGMLCYELARFIDGELDDPLYPAVAGVGDRCDIPEVDRLIENAQKTREELLQMAIVIDYLAYFFKFDGGDGVYEKVFTDPSMVELIGSKVKGIYDSKLQSILPHLASEEINGVCYTELDLENFTQRGKYPTPGKVLGMIHDHLVEEKKPNPVFTIGYFADGIIIRATHPIVPVPDLLEKLQTQMPEANVDGGGHEMAGSLKYLSAYGQNVKDFLKEEIRSADLSSTEI